MARIRITVVEQGMQAVAHATAGPATTDAELRAALAAAKVVHGIDAAAVAAFAARLADATFAGQAVLARGEPPRDGTDGRVDGLAAPHAIAGDARADGSVDYHDRHLLVPIHDGAELGRIVPPTAGAPGRDVTGVVRPARPGKAHAERVGAGARVVGDRVVATRSGVLLRDARLIDVVPLYTHGGDVDYASGSLHTDGSLEVRGDVHEGFTAVASGDLHVTGAVLGGTVRAGNDLRIDQGLLGAAASAIAGGELRCRHATAALLQAGATVALGDQAAHCRIRGEALEAKDGHGTVFGGEVRVRSGIRLRVAGTPAGAPTHLIVGDVSDEASAAIRSGNTDAKVALRVQQRAASGSPPGAKALRTGLRAADAALEDNLRLRVRQRELLATAVVEVDDTVHVGVRVSFGQTAWVCDRTRHHLRLRWSPVDETIVEETMR